MTQQKQPQQSQRLWGLKECMKQEMFVLNGVGWLGRLGCMMIQCGGTHV